MSKSTTPRTDACEKIATRRHGYYDRFAIARELESELAETKGQRDRLAEALRELCETLLVKEPRDITDLLHKAGEALAAVKGEEPVDPHKYCRGGGGNNFHCGCKYDA